MNVHPGGAGLVSGRAGRQPPVRTFGPEHGSPRRSRYRPPPTGGSGGAADPDGGAKGGNWKARELPESRSARAWYARAAPRFNRDPPAAIPPAAIRARPRQFPPTLRTRTGSRDFTAFSTVRASDRGDSMGTFGLGGNRRTGPGPVGGERRR